MFIYHENQSAQNITKLSVTLPISTIHNIFKVAGLFVVLLENAYFKIGHPEFAVGCRFDS